MFKWRKRKHTLLLMIKSILVFKICLYLLCFSRL